MPKEYLAKSRFTLSSKQNMIFFSEIHLGIRNLKYFEIFTTLQVYLLLSITTPFLMSGLVSMIDLLEARLRNDFISDIGKIVKNTLRESKLKKTYEELHMKTIRLMFILYTM